jgi:hypothetical protein
MKSDIGKQRKRETKKQRNRETEKQRNRETEKQRNRETEEQRNRSCFAPRPSIGVLSILPVQIHHCSRGKCGTRER